MKIITYQCDWTNEWIAYDDNYADDSTPHGVGSTVGEAIEDLKNVMEQYLNCPNKYNEWLSEFLSYKAPKPDFIVHAGEWATVWQFQPVSAQALELLDDIHIEDWQWTGNGMFAVDHRPARYLARYIVGEGLTVFHPEYGYFGG